ncbi:sugar transporter SWEET1 isoform X4 [Artibeus jamaicensis]|nr:sugar transporter SWEET1 isoform X4 [Artibeus jamaicensis]XP_053522289.1 sugar transporter SWEET1 isoform X4 [Artibeus jamaicensis]
MRMTRRVDNVQFLPFLTTDVNNLSWLSYGTLKRDGTLIVVNAVGAVLQTSYILVYLQYCPRKHAVLLQTAALLGVLLLGFGYFWLLVPSIEARLQQLGLFCSVFTISMYLSPLTDLPIPSHLGSWPCSSFTLRPVHSALNLHVPLPRVSRLCVALTSRAALSRFRAPPLRCFLGNEVRLVTPAGLCSGLPLSGVQSVLSKLHLGSPGASVLLLFSPSVA